MMQRLFCRPCFYTNAPANQKVLFLLLFSIYFQDNLDIFSHIGFTHKADGPAVAATFPDNSSSEFMASGGSPSPDSNFFNQTDFILEELFPR